jgi:secretion/DNA translocation related TadE-like protein
VSGQSSGEGGAASVLAAMAVALIVLIGLAGAAATQIVRARAVAVAAADAAALAAAPITFPPLGAGRSPVSVARSFAEANGARLVNCRCPRVGTFATRWVEVVVEVPVNIVLLGRQAVRAASRAEFVP